MFIHNLMNLDFIKGQKKVMSFQKSVDKTADEEISS